MRMVNLAEGITASAIGLGTWSFGGPLLYQGRNEGWGRGSISQERATLMAAFDVGITHLDTADIYGRGRAESTIGSIWAQIPRNAVVLATKIGYLEHNGPHNYEPRIIMQHLTDSLTRLRTQYIDILYLHHCEFGDNWNYLDGARRCLTELKAQGVVRALGLSSWRSDQLLEAAQRFRPDVVQVYRNVADDEFEASGLRAFCQSNGIGSVFFSALKHGLLVGSHRKESLAPDDFRRNRQEFLDPEVAAQMKARALQLTRRFAGSHSPVLKGLIGSLFVDNITSTCLVGARTPTHLDHVADAAEPVSAADARWISKLYAEPVKGDVK